LPNGEEVFQACVIPVRTRRSVYVEKNGDAVCVKGHEEDDTELQKSIAKSS
jgi:hypothetical protein